MHSIFNYFQKHTKENKIKELIKAANGWKYIFHCGIYFQTNLILTVLSGLKNCIYRIQTYT